MMVGNWLLAAGNWQLAKCKKISAKSLTVLIRANFYSKVAKCQPPVASTGKHYKTKIFI